MDPPQREPEAISALLARMTLAEKISLLHGAPEDRSTDQGEAGYLPGIARLGIPPLRFADGPPGVLTRFPATALPGTMALAATFSRDDARDNGSVIARDAKALGIDVVLEPYINLHRDQAFPRAYNSLGEDPLLTGAIGAALIEGIQRGGVMAEAKHFIAYDGANDVKVGPQALHEIYLAPFVAAIDAGVAAIMCSYNRVDGAYACGNRDMLTDVLRHELGFTGLVTSDWGAVHDTLFINAGLDLEMPGSGTVMTSYLAAEPPSPGSYRKPLSGPILNLMPEEEPGQPAHAGALPVPGATPNAPTRAVPVIWRPAAIAAATSRVAALESQVAAAVLRIASATPIGLGPALRGGSVSEQTIDQAAGHVLGQMARFGLLGRTAALEPSADGVESPEAQSAAAAIARRTAEDAAVLLKNDAQTLPLRPDELGSIAMLGPGALQTIAVGQSGEKALGRVDREVSPSIALGAAGAVTALGAPGAQDAVPIVTAVCDDMSGSAIPAAYLAHRVRDSDHPRGARSARNDGPEVRAPVNPTDENLAAGLERLDVHGRALTVDAQLDFTRASGRPLPPGTHATWNGAVRIPHEGRYWVYLQALGATATLTVDGTLVAQTSHLDLHGNVLQPAQDSVLPTRDGLDNVRKALSLRGGWHAVSVQVEGEPSGQPVQVRLAWVTPEQRRADYQHALDVARHARKVLVFAWSRGVPVFALPGDQDRLISDVAAVNPNTIVVLNISEPIAMPWLDKVKAVLLMWYPGDEGGWASADLLLGRVSPSGRLPFTWPKRLEDNVANDPAHPERSSSGVDGKTLYSEGIFIGYRWFDQQQIAPLYPFGFGLSYTRFDYSNLVVAAAADGGLDVNFRVHNGGAVASDEVAQLYLGPPLQQPPGVQFAPRALAQFARLHLAAGASAGVRLHVAPRALQYWSSAEQGWRVAKGGRTLYVAASSRDPRLQTAVTIH
jgi:beta-glucosidase